MTTVIRRIMAMLSPETKRGLWLIGALMMVGMMLEMLSIGLFIPVLGLILDPAKASKLPAFLDDLLPLSDPKFMAVTVCVVFAAVYLVKNALLARIAHHQNVFVQRRQAEFSRDLLRRYLAREYLFHVQRNSADLIRNVSLSASRMFAKGVLPTIQICSEILTLTGMLAVLLAVDPVATLTALALLGTCAVGLQTYLRRRLRDWGAVMHDSDGRMLQCLQQSLGSIKETKLSGRTELMVDHFFVPATHRAEAGAWLSSVSTWPRLTMEVVAVTGLAVVVSLGSIRDIPTVDTIALLGVLGLAAMRMIPGLGRMMSNANLLREVAPVCQALYEDFQVPHQDPPLAKGLVHFRDSLQIVGVDLTYPGQDRKALDGINLSLNCGRSLALVGRSGSGKSTLVDAVLGLLKIDSGKISADGVDIFDDLTGWQSHIGYVPQNIYIVDDSLRRNIALGLADQDIDDSRIRQVLQMAQLDELAASWPQGADTRLGEHGNRLSGGQRQRVGIARALYHNPDLLVFDEATSALDPETEQNVAQTIQSLSGRKTVLIVAHRLASIKHCDQIALMDDGKLVAVGSYDRLMDECPSFRRLVHAAENNPDHRLDAS